MFLLFTRQSIRYPMTTNKMTSTSKTYMLQSGEEIHNWLDQDTVSPSLRCSPLLKQNREQVTQKFEEIIEQQLNQLLVKHSHILRDFSHIQVKKTDYHRICENQNDYAIMHASGSGMSTSWFLYHSQKRNKLFMIWVSERMSGFRDDTRRIKFI